MSLTSEAQVPGPPVSASYPAPALPLRAQAPHLQGDSASLVIPEISCFHITAQLFVQFLTKHPGLGSLGRVMSLEAVASVCSLPPVGSLRQRSAIWGGPAWRGPCLRLTLTPVPVCPCK